MAQDEGVTVEGVSEAGLIPRYRSHPPGMRQSNAIHGSATGTDRRARVDRAQLRASRLSPEGEEILRLAVIWEPYGGPSNEEIFVRFGVSRRRFGEVLADAVKDAGIEQSVADRLLNAYVRDRFESAIGRCRPRAAPRA